MNSYKVALAGLLVVLPNSQPLHAKAPSAGEVMRSLAVIVGCGYGISVLVGHSIPHTKRALNDTGLLQNDSIKGNSKELGILLAAFASRLPMHNFIADRLASLYMKTHREAGALTRVKTSLWGKFARANAYDVGNLAKDGLCRAGADKTAIRGDAVRSPNYSEATLALLQLKDELGE